MTKEVNKFDALAHAISVLGQPHEVSKNRFFEASHGLVSCMHLWALPGGKRWLTVEEWSDGDQSTSAGDAGWTYPSGVRGKMRSAYEARARWLIDAYAEAAK